MSESAYVMKVSLIDSKPAIWRRFCVPGQTTLDRLHDIIQIVMGWQECHLHSFTIAGQRYTEAPGDHDDDAQEESGFTLAELVPQANAKFTYQYDYGDDWQHELRVESISEVPEGHKACIGCMDGKRNCPPEDVGGIDGFNEFLAAIRDSKHPEHASYLDWCGGSYDPRALDLDLINGELAKYARWSRPRAVSQELLAGSFPDA